MERRQSTDQWLIVEHLGPGDEEAVRNLRCGSGVLVIGCLSEAQHRRLRRLARVRGLAIVVEGPRSAARVHDVSELRRALLHTVPLILLSPMFRTDSHPEWPPLPKMRAAALARLGGRRLVALGGMDARKFARVKHLGFQAWAGISAFRT